MCRGLFRGDSSFGRVGHPLSSFGDLASLENLGKWIALHQLSSISLGQGWWYSSLSYFIFFVHVERLNSLEFYFPCMQNVDITPLVLYVSLMLL